VYRDCAALEKLGNSPVSGAAALEAELLADGIVSYGLSYDSTLWEMLAQSYYDAYHMNTALGDSWLQKSANAFEQVIELGIRKEYLFSNLFSIHYELGDYSGAEETLTRMKEHYAGSYTPHALRCMLLITIENNKAEAARNYDTAYQEYENAKTLLKSSDDATYLQQVETLIKELQTQGWLSER
jgi:serine/threonine-protein kinase